jgi:hypothetical protein
MLVADAMTDGILSDRKIDKTIGRTASERVRAIGVRPATSSVHASAGIPPILP